MKYKKYDSAIKDILKSSSEAALTHIRDLRSEDKIKAAQILEQKLMSFRLAIKAGTASQLDESALNIDMADSVFLRAEAYFVRSLVLIHKEKLLEAAENFAMASEFYSQEKLHENSLLGRFNALIARANAGSLTAQEELQTCTEILLEGREKNVFKIQGLCLRQKSYCYFSTERFRAALQEMTEALPLIEAHCPVSDHHLSLIHAADCAIELGNFEQAKTYLDYLPPEVDTRIAFPRAYALAKLEQKRLDLTAFEDVNSHWKNRYTNYLSKQSLGTMADKIQWQWDAKSHRIIGANKQLIGKVKPQSLEGNFLKLLMKGPQSKELVCEVLWPEFSTSENLDDRFFRIKNRLQQKIGNFIVFDGQRYLLSVQVSWRLPS
jgi:tetratricopeptide (TPR) repeat protein